MSDCENKETISSDNQGMESETLKKDVEPVKEEVKKADPDEAAGGDATANQEEKPKTNGKGSDSEEEDEEEEPNKTEEKKESDEESEEEDEDEELKPGLLEQPLVRTGKREKKKVERLTMSSPAADKKKNEIQEGSGTKLGDIPRVEFELSKTLADNLKMVHRVCFNRPGSSHEVKRNLRQFSGFTFKKGSQEYERKAQAIAKLHLNQVKALCTVFDVEKKGVRDEIVERIMQFLMEPKPTGKSLPQKRKRASSGKGKKLSTGGKRGRKPGSKNKNKKETKSKDDAGSDNEDEDDDDSSVEDSDEDKDEEAEDSEQKESEEEEEIEEKKPPKKKAKKEEKPKKEAKKESPKKASKTPTKETKKEKKRKSEDEKGDSKKAKKPPNDDELKDVIKKILEGANLEEVTMKTLCKQVYAKYPDFDLTDKKDFIKSTVKQIIR